MFDDFMHNNFPEMHIHQAHQDAMLHAQNQAMDQATGTQREAAHGMPALKPQAPEPVPPAGPGNATINFGLLLETALLRILSFFNS